MPTDTTILVVEDFKPFRDYVSSLLEEQAHLRVICEVPDGLEAVDKIRELKPDLILLDIGLPGLNGIEVARQISALVPRPKIVFLTQEASVEVAQEALRVGGIGYVVKSRAAGDLLVAIEAALEGKKFVSAGLDSD